MVVEAPSNDLMYEMLKETNKNMVALTGELTVVKVELAETRSKLDDHKALCEKVDEHGREIYGVKLAGKIITAIITLALMYLSAKGGR